MCMYIHAYIYTHSHREVLHNCLSYSSVKNWFETGHLCTERNPTLWETNSSDSSIKLECHSFCDSRQLKFSVNPGNILRKSSLYYSYDFLCEKAFSQMSSQMSHCCSEAWLNACFTSHLSPISVMILLDFLTVSQLWMKLASMFMIQGQKNNARNGGTVFWVKEGICL